MSEQEKSLRDFAIEAYKNAFLRQSFDRDMRDLADFKRLPEWSDNAIDAVAQAVAARVREECAQLAETLKTVKAWLPTGPNGEGEDEHTTTHGAKIAQAIRAMNEASHE